MQKANKVKVTDANILFLAVSIIMIIGGMLITGALALYYGNSERVLDEQFNLIMVTNQIFLILLPTVLFAAIKRFQWKEVFRLRGFSPLAGLIIVLAIFCGQFIAIFLNLIVVYPLTLFGRVPASPIPVPGNLQELLISTLVIAVLPGICEEALNRGIVMKAYENRGSIKAVFISAIFFGVFHYDIQNLLGATFLGIIIGYAVIRTNSIFAGVLAHFSNNFISLLMSFFFSRNEPKQDFITIHESEIFTMFLYSIAAAALLYLLNILFTKITHPVLAPPITTAWKDFISSLTHWPVIVVLFLYFFMLMASLFIIFIGNQFISMILHIDLHKMIYKMTLLKQYVKCYNEVKQ